MLGFRWDHKLQAWVVFDKATGKILAKRDTEKDIKHVMYTLKDSQLDDSYKARRIH